MNLYGGLEGSGREPTLKHEKDLTSEQKAVLAAEETLVAQLREQDFQGPLWDRFAEKLAAYAFQVIRKWVLTMRMSQRRRERGLAGRATLEWDGRPWTTDDADELTIETIAVSIRKFRDEALRAGKWVPGKGGSLKTYFVGRCVLEFPNVYRRWKRETRPISYIPLDEVVDDIIASGEGADPETTALLRLELAEALQTLVKDDRTEFILRYRAAGYSNAEIAGLLHTSEKAVESALYRHRERLRRGSPRSGHEGERG